MFDVSMKDRRTSEQLKKLVGVEAIRTVIKSGRLRWYGHLVRKCMEYRVDSRRPVGRPRKTRVENVEADMTEEMSTSTTTNSRCHQQLGPHNTKHKHPNQSAKHHTTTNIITRHHHGV